MNCNYKVQFFYKFYYLQFLFFKNTGIKYELKK